MWCVHSILWFANIQMCDALAPRRYEWYQQLDEILHAWGRHANHECSVMRTQQDEPTLADPVALRHSSLSLSLSRPSLPLSSLSPSSPPLDRSHTNWMNSTSSWPRSHSCQEGPKDKQWHNIAWCWCSKQQASQELANHKNEWATRTSLRNKRTKQQTIVSKTKQANCPTCTRSGA